MAPNKLVSTLKERSRSCSLCRRRKLRCNREFPCSNCARSRNGTCVYENQSSALDRQPTPNRTRDIYHPAATPGTSSHTSTASTIPSTSTGTASTVSSAPSPLPNVEAAPTTHQPKFQVTHSPSAWRSYDHLSTDSTREVDSIRSEIKQLEERLSKATSRSQSSHEIVHSDSEIPTARIGGTLTVHSESRVSDQDNQALAITRSLTHKNRLFGQSHWVNGVTLFKDIFIAIEPTTRDEGSRAVSGMKRCKALAAVIKARRTPQWPSPSGIGLPSKDLADELIDCYLRTSEAVYRVLHIPTFRRDYEALWSPDAEPDAGFLIQLKLVLAIGATVFDDQFSLRTSAVQWVHEAHTWLSGPGFKSRLGIQFLQTNLLLLLARETASVQRDLVWISVGAVLRTAVHMGLHRDPARAPDRTAFAAEMRRRLWNTTLEIALQSSVTSGGPPLISLDDFDTEGPDNFDDEQLLAEGPVPRPDGTFTQMSVAIALRQTFPLRLAIAKFLNNLSSHGTYEETLALDAELRTSYKALCRDLQKYDRSAGPAPSPFAVRVVNFLMHRYHAALHVPFFSLALHENSYAFSRKVVVETSLKIWRTAYPATAALATQQPRDTTPPSERNDLARLVGCGSGFFRTVALQSTLLIGAELRAQLHEEESLGPVLLRPDLLSVVLEEARAWALQCIVAGETNIKGYLLTNLVAAQIEGLMRGLGKDALPALLVRAVEETEESALPVLEDMAARGRKEGDETWLDQMTLHSTPETMDLENWDFMSSMFNFNNAAPMNWAIGEEPTQESSFWR